MKRIFLISAFAMASMVTYANTEPTKAAAAPTPSKADIMARGQQIASTVCVACHGLDGASALPTNPNLAGMPEQYIAKQLALFKEGKRENAIMLGMASALQPDDMKAVGAYYFAQRAKPNAIAKDEVLAKKGQKIYRAGIPELKIPACAGCHGGAGAGIPAVYPKLAGQWSDYSLAQLKSYAAGTRKNTQMNAIAGRMREADMLAVTEYIAGMRAN